MPVGNLPGWRQTWTDNLTTNVPLGSFPGPVSSQWFAYTGHDTSGNGLYDQTRIDVTCGVMSMNVSTIAGVPRVNAPGVDAQSTVYGRYAVRFRSDVLPGYKTAWLLWPTSNVWPRDGEIDFPEMDLGWTIVNGFVHHQGGTSGADQDGYSASIDVTQWHTAVIEWSPNLVRFLLDGVEIGRDTTRVPSTQMYWVLQTETQLSGGAPSPSVAGRVQVDWVAQWAYDPSIT